MTNTLAITLTIIIVMAVFFLFLLYKVIQIRKKKTIIGTFIGERATTIDTITPQKPGFIRFKGEYWKATSDVTISPNVHVVIVGKDETMLKVKPLEK